MMPPRRTWKQKFSLAVRGTFDPVAFIGVGFAPGIEHTNNSFARIPPRCVRTAQALCRKVCGQLLANTVFPSLFHQDPRSYQGSGTFKSRLAHAVDCVFSRAAIVGVTSRTTLICLATCAQQHCPICTIQKQIGERTWSSRSAAVGLAGRVSGNLIREFLSKHLTTT